MNNQGRKIFLRSFVTLQKILLLLVLCCFFSTENVIGNEKLSYYISVAGTLSDSLTKEQKQTVKELTVSGEIDARDFKFIRESLPLIQFIDIEQCQVKAYTGNGGTSQTLNIYLQDEVPDYAFYSMQTLKGVKLPLSVKTIGIYVFNGCKMLESVFLHKNIIKIGDFTFVSCDNLKSFEIDKDNLFFSAERSALFNKEKTILYQMNYSDSETYIVPSTVKQIYRYALYANKNIKEVLLPEALVQIGYAAFMNCRNLELLKVPATLKRIGDYAFAYCVNLKSDISEWKLPVQTGAYAFYFCNNIRGIYKVEGQTKISPWSFYKCEKLEGVQFVDNLCSVIGEYAFSDNLKMNGSIIFPESISIIEAGAFSGCKEITQIEFSSSNVVIERGAFRNCENITGELNLPTALKEVKNFCFFNCKKIAKINFPDSLQKIGDFSFACCAGIADTLRLPEGLKMIGKNAFEACKSIKYLVIPSSLEIISHKAFVKCVDINEIVLNSDSLAKLNINLKKTFPENVIQRCILKVPSGSIEKFRTTVWGAFKNIVEY